MNYEQKYKEALERARNMHEQGMSAERLEYVFPELRESEDERIRKSILELVKQSSVILSPMNQKSMISWLEKQKESKESYCGKSLGKEESESDDLDFLVISLEETIGTSPHSREVIKEYLQKAAEWGRTHFEDKSEMVSEDLEEAAEIYYEQDCPYEGEARVINNEHDVWFPSQAIEDAFVAGAKWKSYQMHSNCTESVDLQTMMNMRFEDGRIAGMEEMKQQMIKDAVEAFVNTYENTDDSNYVEFVTEQSPYKFKEAEKCKIIIIKEDNNEQGCREKN